MVKQLLIPFTFDIIHIVIEERMYLEFETNDNQILILVKLVQMFPPPTHVNSTHITVTIEYISNT